MLQSRITKLLAILFISFSVYIDYSVKTFVDQNVRERSQKIVTPYFSIVKVWNRGVSFGLFDKIDNNNLFLAINLLITLWLFKMLLQEKKLIDMISFSLIIAGAIGNLIDRLRFRAVLDFLDFHIKSLHWFPFNIADSLICVGGAIWFVSSVLESTKSPSVKK